MQQKNNFLIPNWADNFNLICGFTLPFYGNQALTRPSKSGSLRDNRIIFSKSAHFELNKIFAPHQIHSNQVIFVDESNVGRGVDSLENAVDGDACWTKTSGVTLITTWADCIPVILYDASQNIVAAIHSGWRGTASNVVKQTIVAMKSNPSDVYASVGPGIRGCCYEVGQNVAEIFEKMSKKIRQCVEKREEKFFLDLQSVVYQQLLECNILAEKIDRSTMCTCCNKNPNFFSCRKDGKDNFEGQAAFICLK